MSRKRIHLWQPNINGIKISNIDQLIDIINREYPCLKRYPIFPTLLSQAKSHLELFNRLCKVPFLTRGELTKFSRELGVKRSLVSVFVTKAGRPRLYFYIERCVPKTQIALKLQKLHFRNRAINSLNELKKRLCSYYLHDDSTNNEMYEKQLSQCEKYFTALTELIDGGCYKVVAQTVGTNQSRIIWWSRGQRPAFLMLASLIPIANLRPDNKWLPLTMIGNFHPTNFIQVPEHVKNWVQISEVVKKLRSLDNKNKALWMDRFGSIDKESAFGYILGIMVSDASKHKDSSSSIRIGLGLSKSYNWSEKVGQATCYYLNILGLKAKRGKDIDSNYNDKRRHFWYSERSPLLKWMQRSCLGLSSNENTTYHAIKAEWLLNAPQHVKIKFLQGLNDGDGWASVKCQVLANACEPNTSLIKSILKTLNINSYIAPDRILIKEQDSVIKAVNLPFFLHATEKQNLAEKLARMIQTHQKTKPKINKINIQILINKYFREGYSTGKISEKIFDETGMSFTPTQIQYYIKRMNNS